MQETRQTRILATLGPATETEEIIGDLMDVGANLFRLNMSHARHDWVRRVEENIRAAAGARGQVPGIVMDLQGPSIRTGELPAPVMLRKGDRFDFTIDPKLKGERLVSVNYPDFLDDIEESAIIQVDNGLIRMRVLRITGAVAECEVEIGGEMGSRRHINLPGTKVKLPALTDKDKTDVALGLETKVDYIALSFVREASDVAQLREFIAGEAHLPKVIAKVEDQYAIKNINAIIEETDAIMVARGDLGVECPFEDLPILQRQIVRSCQLVGKPVIVATHMLESMVGEPIPTRAEVTDVANAVFEQADAIMLSSETSVGQFPLMCVEAMDRIARRMECEDGARFYEEAVLSDERQKLAKVAVQMADDMGARALVVFTVEGKMVPESAWMRPREANIMALCPSERVAGEMSLYRGVVPIVMEEVHSELPAEEEVEAALETLKEKALLKSGDTVVVISSHLAVGEIADSVQMHRVS